MRTKRDIEREILSLWEEDKEFAFELLVKHFAEPLYRFIRYIVHTHEDADDVLQETFLKSWKGLKNFRGESSLETFLHRIAYNEAISFLRKQRRRFKIFHPFSNYEDWYLERVKADPYVDFESAYEEVLKEIALLPPRQKSVFSLRHFEGLSFREISERLGISESTARVTYHQTINKLKSKLKGLNIVSPETSIKLEHTNREQ